MATKKSYADSELLEIGDELDENGQLAENILQAIANENRKPKYEEMQWLKLRCGWDERAVNTQISRVMRVVRNLRIAGSVDDRAAMKTEAAKAVAVLESEGAKIAAQIETLQSKLNGLERAARLAEKRLLEMDEAIVQLRLEVPKFVRDEYAERSAFVGSHVGSECLALEGELRFLEQMIAIDTGSQEAIEQLRFHFPACLVRSELSQKVSIDNSKWFAQRDELQTQLADLKPKAAALRIEYDQALGEVAALLNFYIE